MNAGEMALAKKNAVEATKKDFGNAKYHALLSLLHLQTKEFSDAQKESAIALQLDPKNFQAALLLAKSHLFAGNYDKAAAILENMQKIAKDNVEILGNLGLTYMGKKEFDKALKTFQKLLTIQPDNTKALVNILKIKAKQGAKQKELIALVKTQLDKQPENVGNLLLMGSLLAKDKQYDKALEIINKVQKIAPKNPNSYAMGAAILSKQKNTDEAIAEYNKLLKQNPQNTMALMSIGALLEQKGDKEGARKKYEKVLSLQPDFAPAANNLAWLIAESKEPDLGEALRLSMIAKEQYPDEVHITDTLGWIHYKRTSYSLARNEFAQAVEKQPDTPVFRYHLALALHGEGKTMQALQELKKALASKAAFAERDEALQTLDTWKQKQK